MLSTPKVTNFNFHFIGTCILLGATPIVPVLRQVLREKRNQIYERNLLILIATDGIPTDERERTDIGTFEHVLRNERQPTQQIPVTILVCTDDKQSMAYLNDWDKKIPNLDVVDNYRNERQSIRALRGNNVPFSFGDVNLYICIFLFAFSCLVYCQNSPRRCRQLV